MADLDLATLAAQLLGPDTQKEIAASNPYYSLAGMAPQVSDLGLKAYQQIKEPDSGDLKELAILSGISGLAGGLLGNLGANYQNKLTGRYIQALEQAKAREEITVEGLPAGLFDSVQQKAALWRMVNEQKLVDDLNEVAKAGLTEAAKEKGKLSVYGEGGNNLMNPANKEKRYLEDTTYNRISKLPAFDQFSDIETNFKTLIALANEDSRPASIGMISALARIWDPNGTVREGEYAINAKAQSALDSLVGDWREIVLGKGKLAPEGKKAVIEAAAQKYNEFGSSYQAQKQALLEALARQGGDPTNIPTLDYKRFDGLRILRNKRTGEVRLEPR